MIEPTEVLNTQNSLEIELTVTNIGRLSVFNVNFGCELEFKNRTKITVVGSSIKGVSSQKIDKLSPGESFTRKCALGLSQIAVRPFPVSVDAGAEYEWPLIRMMGEVVRHFNSRQGPNGRVILVPDSN